MNIVFILKTSSMHPRHVKNGKRQILVIFYWKIIICI